MDFIIVMLVSGVVLVLSLMMVLWFCVYGEEGR